MCQDCLTTHVQQAVFKKTLSITEKHLLRGEKVYNASYVMHRALHSLFMQSLYRIDSVRSCVFAWMCPRYSGNDSNCRAKAIACEFPIFLRGNFISNRIAARRNCYDFETTWHGYGIAIDNWLKTGSTSREIDVTLQRYQIFYSLKTIVI